MKLRWAKSGTSFDLYVTAVDPSTGADVTAFFGSLSNAGVFVYGGKIAEVGFDIDRAKAAAEMIARMSTIYPANHSW